ncbi:MAG: apolipoprotein N-acyltransferase [bacterium]|nr:apolipoprotein N-acyltransferase [bacterium]
MGKTYPTIISGAAIGLILALSQPLYNLGILIFPGFILFFLALKLQGSPVNSGFLLGYSAGLAYFLINFKWHWTVYPLKDIGIENPYLGFFLVFSAWAIIAGVLALTWGISAGLWKKLDKKISWAALLIFPSVFTLLEYLRSFLIGWVWAGPGTPLGPNWTIGSIAYNLHESFLTLKFASWFGIYGLTFVIIFLGLLLFIFLEKRSYRKLLITALAIVIFIYLPALQGSPVATGLPCSAPCTEVAVIQTKIPNQVFFTPEEEISIFKNQLELIDEASKNFPQTKLIVFPEGGNFFKTLTLFRNTAGASQYFSGLFPHSALIVDNSKIATESKFQSKTIFLDSQKGVLDSYDKYLLAPMGEYAPLILKTLDRILGLNTPAIQEKQEYQTGTKPPEAIDGETAIKAGSLVCSDIFSPSLAKNLTATGAGLIISQSSFSFIEGASDLFEQDLAAAKFRAAENGRYLVKASNFGRSYIISDQGIVQKITPGIGWQILTGSVVLKDNQTLYNKTGDSPILLGSLAILTASLFLRKNEHD